MRVAFKTGFDFKTVIGNGDYTAGVYTINFPLYLIRDVLKTSSLCVAGVDADYYAVHGADTRVYEVSSAGAETKFKLIAPAAMIDRIKNVEDALVELYELLEV